MRYRREDGSYVSQEDMDYLKNRGAHAAPVSSNGGKMTPAKLWLLILATVVVVAGIVFGACEIYMINRAQDQSQQVIDWGKKEMLHLNEIGKDLNK